MKVHMTLQGKGGVSKSMITAVLGQYKEEKGSLEFCADTDPVNATLAAYEGLNVRRLEIMEGDEVNARNFDQLIEWIAVAKLDVVVDNGASSFIPLCSYLIDNQIPSLLNEMGHELIVHVVITGGQAYDDTVNGFVALVTQMPAQTKFVVWLNPFWGPVAGTDGVKFEDSEEYRAHKKRISAIVQVPNLKADTYGRDFSDMLQEHMTFNEAIANGNLSIMTRQRLKIVKEQFYTQLDNLAVI